MTPRRLAHSIALTLLATAAALTIAAPAQAKVGFVNSFAVGVDWTAFAPGNVDRLLVLTSTGSIQTIDPEGRVRALLSTDLAAPEKNVESTLLPLPDGRFVVVRTARPSAKAQITVLDSAGTTTSTWTLDGLQDIDVRPDGMLIAAGWYTSGIGLLTLTPEGAVVADETLDVPTTDFVNLSLAALPTATWLAIYRVRSSSQYGEFDGIDRDGGSFQRIEPLDFPVGVTAMPDGSFLAFVRCDGYDGLPKVRCVEHRAADGRLLEAWGTSSEMGRDRFVRGAFDGAAVSADGTIYIQTSERRVAVFRDMPSALADPDGDGLATMDDDCPQRRARFDSDADGCQDRFLRAHVRVNVRQVGASLRIRSLRLTTRGESRVDATCVRGCTRTITNLRVPEGNASPNSLIAVSLRALRGLRLARGATIRLKVAHSGYVTHTVLLRVTQRSGRLRLSVVDSRCLVTTLSTRTRRCSAR